MAQQIKSLIKNILAHENNWKITLLQNWHEILGNLSSRVRLEKIENNTLTLAVQDSCLMQELYMLSPVFLESINKKLDAPYIKHLRFKKAGYKKKKKKYERPRTCHIPPPKKLQLHEKQALTNIKDPELAQFLKAFLVRCHRERDL